MWRAYNPDSRSILMSQNTIFINNKIFLTLLTSKRIILNNYLKWRKLTKLILMSFWSIKSNNIKTSCPFITESMMASKKDFLQRKIFKKIFFGVDILLSQLKTGTINIILSLERESNLLKKISAGSVNFRQSRVDKKITCQGRSETKTRTNR